MVNLCIVKKCINSSTLTKKKCTMFKLPKDELRRKNWLINCGRQDLLEKSTVYRTVCSEHFENEMYSNPDRTVLFRTAVPTDFSLIFKEHACSTSCVNTSISDPLLFNNSVATSTPTKQKELISISFRCINLAKLTRPSIMFSNRQQQNSSNLLHQNISSSGPVVLPPPPPAIAIPTMVLSNSSAVTSVATTILALDGLNCGGIPTRTTPTLTPTTLRTIAADIANLSPAPSENFATATSDLHHLVSSSCSTMSTSTLGASDRTDLQERVNIHNLSNQTLSLQSINNQQISLNNLQNHQNVNQNTLNQQQRNDYNNSFSTAASRQAGFVPPLVLQINSTNPIAQQSTGSTILLNNNTSSGSSSIFSAKGSSTTASSSHWQGVVVTQRPQKRARSITTRQFTDDEDGDDDYDSAADDGTDSSDTTSSKMTRKQNNKNNKSKNGNKNEFKNSSGGGRRTNNKDNKMMSAEEEQRRQVRRERNKLAAARCRKRRMDHTNELLEETGQLEDKRLRLQVEIQGLRQQKTDLQQMLAQHKCAVNMNNVQLSNSVATVNHATTILDSNEISETKPIILSNHLSSIKGSPLQQNISTNVVINDNDSNNVDDIIIKHEDNLQTDIDTKDSINIIPTSVMQQPHRRRPTTLLQLNNGNFGNSKKISGNGSTGVVVLNFDSLMDGGTGLTPVSSSGGSVQNHHQQVQHSSTGNGGVNTENNSVLS